jgi:hypothetical protein
MGLCGFLFNLQKYKNNRIMQMFVKVKGYRLKVKEFGRFILVDS